MKLPPSRRPLVRFRPGPPLSNLFVYSRSLRVALRHHPLCSAQTRPQYSHTRLTTTLTTTTTLLHSILLKIHIIIHPTSTSASNRFIFLQKYKMSASVSRKRKTPEPERDAFNHDEVTTPSNSPARKKLKITQHQKQTLIDNLQLESASLLSHADYVQPLVSILTVYSHRASPPITRPICDASSRSSLTH